MNRRRTLARIWVGTLAVLVAAGLLLWAWVALSPPPPLLAGVDFSPVLLNTQGQPLRLGLTRDEKYRVRTRLREVTPETLRAMLLYEDRHFYAHPGVNPLSMLRASWHMLTGGRRMGGSTLTMQVARLRLGLDTTTIMGKAAQMVRALQLEYHYSKQEILEAYCNLAPYGGNVEGLGAAAHVYFHTPPGRLTLSQSLALTPVPQNPASRHPLRQSPAFREARERMHQIWREAVDPDTPPPPPLRVHAPEALPFAAPHLAAELLPLARARAHEPVLHTYIDPALQNLLETALHRFAARGRAFGLHNAAALLVHWPSMEVRALVGSADFHNAAIDGQVDGTRARRSPGSALKPFIYALALDQGHIHPQTLLPDTPRSFGGYDPENFDRVFRGPLPAHEALRASRNLPAVWLASRLHPGLYAFLRRAGVAMPQSETHYGLSLVLGGAEVTMRETAALYALLANGGIWRPLRLHRDEEPAPGIPLISPEAALVTLNMLEDPRHTLPSRQGTLPLRLKTGTSNGFRDAWTAGVVGPYVLVIWAGNFDNAPNPLLVGGEVAAPLFEDTARALSLLHPLSDPLPARMRELNLTRLPVCTQTGDLDTTLCADTTETWFLPGRSPTRDSGVYRTILVDGRTGLRACEPDPAHTREVVWEFWPTDLRALFLRAGVVKEPPPPFGPECARTPVPGRAPNLIIPKDGVTYTRRLSDPARSAIPLTASVDADAHSVFWFAGERYLGRSAPDQPLVWRPGDGEQEIRAMDDLGRETVRTVRVTTVP